MHYKATAVRRLTLIACTVFAAAGILFQAPTAAGQAVALPQRAFVVFLLRTDARQIGGLNFARPAGHQLPTEIEARFTDPVERDFKESLAASKNPTSDDVAPGMDWDTEGVWGVRVGVRDPANRNNVYYPKNWYTQVNGYFVNVIEYSGSGAKRYDFLRTPGQMVDLRVELLFKPDENAEDRFGVYKGNLVDDGSGNLYRMKITCKVKILASSVYSPNAPAAYCFPQRSNGTSYLLSAWGQPHNAAMAVYSSSLDVHATSMMTSNRLKNYENIDLFYPWGLVGSSGQVYRGGTVPLDIDVRIAPPGDGLFPPYRETVAHEWGHVIQHYLNSGSGASRNGRVDPLSGGYGTHSAALSEGWADFVQMRTFSRATALTPQYNGYQFVKWFSTSSHLSSVAEESHAVYSTKKGLGLVHGRVDVGVCWISGHPYYLQESDNHVLGSTLPTRSLRESASRNKPNLTSMFWGLYSALNRGDKFRGCKGGGYDCACREYGCDRARFSWSTMIRAYDGMPGLDAANELDTEEYVYLLAEETCRDSDDDRCESAVRGWANEIARYSCAIEP